MRTHGIALALILAVCLGALGMALRNDFVWDDQLIIVRNPGVQDLKAPLKLFTPAYWKVVRADYRAMPRRGYRPVPELLFAVDHALWGFNPAAYHAVSIAVHAANCLLLYVLALRILRDTRAATFCALLFAAHPVHVEAVAWAKARPELLALLFVIGAILLYDRYLSSRAPSRSPYLWICSIGAFGLALMCKASAVILPGLLALYVWCCLPRTSRRAGLFGLLPFAGVAAGFFALDVTVPHLPGMVLPGGGYRVLTTVSALGVYLKLLVVPAGLCAHHRIHTVVSVLDPSVLRALPLGVALLAGTAVALRRSRTAFFALAWMIIGFVPASALQLMGREVGELRAYLPSVGFCLAVALLLARIPHLARDHIVRASLQRASVGLCVLLVAAYAGLSSVRSLDWRNEFSLWSDTAEKNPDSWYALGGLATIYAERGMPEKAIPYLERLVRLDPTSRASRYQLAGAYLQTDQLDAAIAAYTQLAEEDPADGKAQAALGGLYAKKGQNETAMRHFRDALRAAPRSAYAHRQLGVFYLSMGRHTEAIAELTEALRLKPRSPATHHMLGLAYAALGRHAEALAAYRECLRIDPMRAPAWTAMGRCYEELGNAAEASRCYERCRELGGSAADTAPERPEGMPPLSAALTDAQR